MEMNVKKFWKGKKRGIDLLCRIIVSKYCAVLPQEEARKLVLVDKEDLMDINLYKYIDFIITRFTYFSVRSLMYKCRKPFLIIR